MIASDWKNTMDEKELKIIKKHAKAGRRSYMIYASESLNIYIITTWKQRKNNKFYFFVKAYCCSTAACFILIPSLNPLLNIVIPLENSTRPLALPYFAEYFVDQEKYYIPLMSKAAVSGTLSMTIFITYDMAYTMFIYHICSQFDIVW